MFFTVKRVGCSLTIAYPAFYSLKIHAARTDYATHNWIYVACIPTAGPPVSNAVLESRPRPFASSNFLFYPGDTAVKRTKILSPITASLYSSRPIDWEGVRLSLVCQRVRWKRIHTAWTRCLCVS